jgi:cysteinyl-tRNA synthetase
LVDNLKTVAKEITQAKENLCTMDLKPEPTTYQPTTLHWRKALVETDKKQLSKIKTTLESVRQQLEAKKKEPKPIETAAKEKADADVVTLTKNLADLTLQTKRLEENVAKTGQSIPIAVEKSKRTLGKRVPGQSRQHRKVPTTGLSKSNIKSPEEVRPAKEEGVKRRTETSTAAEYGQAPAVPFGLEGL